MAKLIFLGEKFAGRVYELVLPKTTVGRGDRNTLSIHDASVSQTHCEILVFDTEVIVRDLGSSNGTVVDGVRLHNQQRPLHSGQTVKFGSIEARLDLDSRSSADTTEETAILSYARYRREHKGVPEQAAGPVSPSLALGTQSASADQTLMMRRAADVEEITKAAARAPDEPRWPKTAVLIVATLVFGLIIVWLIWGAR